MPPAVSKALFYTLAAGPLPRNTIEVVGPETLTGEDLARIWSEATGKAVSYAGDDLDAFEGMMGQFATGTQARDMRRCSAPSTNTGWRLNPLRIPSWPDRAADFARETVEMWRAQA
jgi:hypothetical protein